MYELSPKVPSNAWNHISIYLIVQKCQPPFMYEDFDSQSK